MEDEKKVNGEIEGETEKNSCTPSKITDYFPSSPHSSDTKQGKDEEKKTTDLKMISRDVLSSSCLLTPDSSPAKEKNKAQKDNSDTDSLTSDSPVAKQVHIEKEEQKSTESKQRKVKGKGSSSSSSVTRSTTDASPTKIRAAKSGRKKKVGEPLQDNKLVTDYFPVRRSVRKPKSEMEKEKRNELEERILQKKEEGLKVVELVGKGRGVVATKVFKRGDFVVEYAGDLIDHTTAKKREEKYSKNPDFGCYMYYFVHKNKNYCIDATAESGRLGRLINHSKTAGNCQTKLTDIRGKPYLMLMASRDISIGEELLYDYGDRSKSSLESHPWLNC